MSRVSEQYDAIVFDWAGTTVDFGSRAPLEVFLEVFRRRGIELTTGEVRGPMGLAKDLHIAALLELPRVREAWLVRHGVAPAAADVASMYEEFLPLQTEILRARTALIPGVAAAVSRLHELGLKIGATTGYARSLMDVVEPLAAAAGYAPAANVCADEVERGRPAPDMNLKVLKLLAVNDPRRAIAVDDTPLGIEAGKAIGMLTIAVTITGNSLGLDAATVAALPAAELERQHEIISAGFLAAGADHAVRSVAEIPALLEKLAA
jgi:phosphonoacetaldehyde hydrolase